MDECGTPNQFLWIALIIIVIAAIFEAVLLGIAFFGADRVECNWYACNFITERGSVVMTQDCFTNGVRVNCSETIDINNSVWNMYYLE